MYLLGLSVPLEEDSCHNESYKHKRNKERHKNGFHNNTPWTRQSCDHCETGRSFANNAASPSTFTIDIRHQYKDAANRQKIRSNFLTGLSVTIVQ